MTKLITDDRIDGLLIDLHTRACSRTSASHLAHLELELALIKAACLPCCGLLGTAEHSIVTCPAPSEELDRLSPDVLELVILLLG